MSYNKWNRVLLTSVSVILLFIFLFNYIINPYSVFEIPDIKYINAVKNNTVSDTMSKFYAAKKQKAKTLLFGTSRTEHIDPKLLEKYTKNKIYNLSIPGSGVAVQRNNIEYFIKKGEIDTIIYGLDFFAFNPANNIRERDYYSGRYIDDYIADYIDSILSMRTFRKSIKTLKDNLENSTKSIEYETGYRTYTKAQAKIQKHGDNYIKKSFSKQLQMISTQIVHFNNDLFKEPHSIDNSLDDFKEVIELCKINNIRLYIFISPLYSEITDLIYQRGYGKTYKYWKKELSKYENIYDFSGYNSITTDISNYIDGSHYQPKIGQLIIGKIFNDTSVKIPDDFGVILNNKNIDIILEKQNNSATINNNMKANQ